MTKEPAVFPMQKHTELINYVAKKIGATFYLEIGVFNREHNFDRIKVVEKACVDPDENAKAGFQMTSDEFFNANWVKLEDEDHKRPILTFDVIFIDGLHHSDQNKKDLINSWACLNEGGVIVVHDANPHSESITTVPRATREWTGNVYITISQIISEKFTIDCDYGCCILRKENKELKFSDESISWEKFDKNRKTLLNLVSEEEGKKIIDSWK